MALEDEGWIVEEAASGEDAARGLRPPAGRRRADRHHAAGHRRVRAVPLAAPLERRADRHGHGPGRHPRRGRRARGRRRRLPHEAVRTEGAVGPHPGAAAPGPPVDARATPACASATSRSSRTKGKVLLRAARAASHQDRVPAAVRAGVEPGPGVQPRGAARAGVGLRLLRRRPARRRPRAAAAHQGRGRPGQPAPRRHGPRARATGCRPEVGEASSRAIVSRFRPRRLGLRARITLTFAPRRLRPVASCSPAPPTPSPGRRSCASASSAIVRQTYVNARIVQNELESDPDLGPRAPHLAAAPAARRDRCSLPRRAGRRSPSEFGEAAIPDELKTRVIARAHPGPDDTTVHGKPALAVGVPLPSVGRLVLRDRVARRAAEHA